MDQKSSRPETQSYSGPGTGSSHQKPNSVGDAINRGRDAVSDATNEAVKSAGPDLQAIQNDLNSLKDTLSRFMSRRTRKRSNQLATPPQISPARLVMSPAISPTAGPSSFLLPGTKRRPSLRNSRSWLVETRSAR
jgi:hypothetical protein